MHTRLTVLDATGDTTLTWDDADEAACADARRTVADLAEKGYSFFLTDGTPADATAPTGGTLVVRRLAPTDVVIAPVEPAPAPVEPAPAPVEPAPAPAEADPVPRRRGRPKGSKNTVREPANINREVTAVRPMRGG